MFSLIIIYFIFKSFDLIVEFANIKLNVCLVNFLLIEIKKKSDYQFL